MDLSFPRFDAAREMTVLPADLAVLLVGIAARQVASPTASIQARIAGFAGDARLLAPLHGAFNGPMAAMLRRWQDE